MNKKILGSLVIIVGILISGSVVYNESADSLRNVTRKEQMEVFEEARKQADVGDNYIEHITEINPDGYVVDIYVDRENYLEQMDQYENNKFKDRMIFYNGGSEYLFIFKDGDSFDGETITLDESIAKENKMNFENHSQFKSEILSTLEQGESTFFREEEYSDSTLIKYKSKNLNLYFDKVSKFLVKKEEIVGDKISKIVVFDKIEKTSTTGKSLFKKEYTGISEEKIDLSNIEIN